MIENQEMRNTREAFGEELLQLARDGFNVYGIGADTSKSMGISALYADYPERALDVGIAEQNMIMTAAGMASDGKIVFAASYSAFTSMRSLEQLRSFVAYPNLNVKVVAGLGGFSAGIEGVTHTALEDLGIIRSIPNVCLLNPADAIATRKAVRAAALHDGPAYIRIGRDSTPVIFDEETYEFEIGKSNIIHEFGYDAVIFATGFPVYESIVACEELQKEGINTTLVDVPSLNPFDTDMVVDLAKKTKFLVSVEEHYYNGGLGSAIAEVTATTYPIKLKRVAVESKYTQSGLPEELKQTYGITVEAIIKAVKESL